MNCVECTHEFGRHDDRAVAACDWFGQVGTRTRFNGSAGPPVGVPVYDHCRCMGWSET